METLACGDEGTEGQRLAFFVALSAPLVVLRGYPIDRPGRLCATRPTVLRGTLNFVAPVLSGDPKVTGKMYSTE